MKYEDIKFFSERCEEHPDHQSGMITNSMIQQRLHEEIDELRAYIESQLAQPEQEPVAIRYDFDGYGYQYIDFGTGSDWQTRVQGEPLYTTPPQIEVCAECGVNGGTSRAMLESLREVRKINKIGTMLTEIHSQMKTLLIAVSGLK